MENTRKSKNKKIKQMQKLCESRKGTLDRFVISKKSSKDNLGECPNKKKTNMKISKHDQNFQLNNNFEEFHNDEKVSTSSDSKNEKNLENYEQNKNHENFNKVPHVDVAQGFIFSGVGLIYVFEYDVEVHTFI